ncbi:DUF1254 domain-containing protein [Vibrio sp. HN007]|uniref:DUF1254 domain-containing protein n=1 Tax=Vibrio iocasae TaxID=3098914 RepID=UPI0035D4C0DF
MTRLNRFLTTGLSIIALTSTYASAQQLTEPTAAEYTGYRITHHMDATIKHIENFGLNTFDHPPIGDYRSFVITPALDHFYSKAVADLRYGPAVVETPARDDRYGSIQVFDMEHYTIFDKVTDKEGERIVLVHEDYKGKLPSGTVVKTKSYFPFVFIRTQSFNFNDDKLADAIRHQAKIYGVVDDVELPNTSEPQQVLQWTYDNKTHYKQSEKLIEKAIATYDAEAHKKAYAYLADYASSGQVVGNPGMFEDIDDPKGGDLKIRATGTLLGHLGFPVHHAYYQNVAVDEKGRRLEGKNGPFKVTLPYKPGVGQFWSVTRYGSDTFLPLNPAEIGGNDIQSYNAYNTQPDKDGNVTFTFSTKDPKDGSYWMPVKEDGYYFVVRYYQPTTKLNGNTAFDKIYGDTKLKGKFKAITFSK